MECLREMEKSSFAARLPSMSGGVCYVGVLWCWGDRIGFKHQSEMALTGRRMCAGGVVIKGDVAEEEIVCWPLAVASKFVCLDTGPRSVPSFRRK